MKSRATSRNIIEMARRDSHRVMAAVQLNNGRAQSVPHLHVHVMPVHLAIPAQEPEMTQMPLPELEKVAATLRAAMR